MAVPNVAEPAEHLVDFLVYVMPGFIALQIFRAKYPAKKLSEFLQVAWSLIYGGILASLWCRRSFPARLASEQYSWVSSLPFCGGSPPSRTARRSPPYRFVSRPLLGGGILAASL